jgi:alkaline phosphatase D
MGKSLLAYFLSVLLLSWGPPAQAQSGAPTSKRVILNADLQPFYHGVASGDPLTDRVIIWTRVTPDSTVGSIDVRWEMATDTTFSQNSLVQADTVTTDTSRDYTVKVDVQHLQPDSWYYYRFIALGDTSIIGRTRTMPQGDVDQMRIAVASCSNYTNGFFTAYGKIAERNDLDVVVHLGDYIYEGGGEDLREHQPNQEIWQLSDYRERHAQYKLDPDLIRAHQQYPWVTVWDDHETANNSYETGAAAHDATEGSWSERKAEGTQAYFEWMPIRPDTSGSIYRTFQLGNLAELIMLDTRLEGRDKQIQDFQNNQAQAMDSMRTLLGEAQFQWLSNELKQSQAQWKLLGNQVMMAPLEANVPPFFEGAINSDQWDGYAYERQRLFDTLTANNINNTVVMTGDIHTNWACDLPLANYEPDSGQNTAGVEFVDISITASNTGPLDLPSAISQPVIESSNPHIKYNRLSGHGYYVLTLDSAKAQADYYLVSTIDTFRATQSLDASWMTRDSSNRLTQASGPAQPVKSYPPLAPDFDDQRDSIYSSRPGVVRADSRSVIAGAYPNPFQKQVKLQIIAYQPGTVQLRVQDLQGKTLQRTAYTVDQPGLLRRQLDLRQLPAGSYILQLQSPGGQVHTKRLIKLGR